MGVYLMSLIFNQIEYPGRNRVFAGLKEGMNFRSVNCPDCGKRLTPHFEGGLEGSLTLDLGGWDI
jgi:hypothetical protein